MAVRSNILTDGAARQGFLDGAAALAQEASPYRPSELGIPLVDGATDTPLSTWDLFVLWHWHAMTTATGGGRNGAHRGPVFLPWHRWFLLEIEAQMQRLLGDADFGLPYWDWPADGDLDDDDQVAGELWTEPVMGTSDADGDVVSGAFSPAAGFRVRVDYTRRLGLVATSRGLRRTPGQRVATLPTSRQVDVVVDSQPGYDQDPWSSASEAGFRNLVEGNLAFSIGSPAELHNRVHVWVGGDMEPPTSPNDPVFYLNHCNVDRLWARWQYRHPASGYEPASGPQSLAFHRRDDPMFRPFWWTDEETGGRPRDPDVRPRDMLDVSVRYTYDTLA